MSKAQIAERFLKHNFHDALLKGIYIESAADRRSKASVHVVLEDYDTDELTQITFIRPLVSRIKNDLIPPSRT